MIQLRKTQDSEIDFIAECLKDKDENFASQCGYGSRFFTYPVTPEQIRSFQNSRKETSEFNTIFNDEIIIGSVELILHKDQNRCSVARFLIADEYRFKGFGTETLHKISEYVFNKTELGKITLTVFDFNNSAIKCYRKAGFRECSRETRDNNWIAISMEKLKI